jgi:cyclophilin family peptidyl-prolyl cis-trans isomerase
VATERRERQRANRALKQKQEQTVEKQERRRQTAFTFSIIAIAVIAGLGLLYLATRSGDDEVAAEDDAGLTATSLTTSTTVAEVAQVAVSVPEPGMTLGGATVCPEADGSSERVTMFSEAPPMCIDETGTYTATFSTNLGDFTAELDAATAPSTVNNFVVLARYHYYENVPFHRIIPGFVVQGGDAVGPILGQGNPGYLIAEEPPQPAEGELAYEVGSLAMAKSAGPNATGAQFFIVTGDQGTQLPPEYSLFGKVTEGMDVVMAIEALPTDARDYPTEEIYINSVTITEG